MKRFLAGLGILAIGLSVPLASANAQFTVKRGDFKPAPPPKTVTINKGAVGNGAAKNLNNKNISNGVAKTIAAGGGNANRK